MFQHAHHAKVTPSFCKTYGRIGAAIQEALNEYKKEVENETFPGTDFSPYKLNADEKHKFEEWSKGHYKRLKEKEEQEKTEATKSSSTQDETIKVY